MSPQKETSEPEECGTCRFCLDKPKRGGLNKLRQACELRQQANVKTEERSCDKQEASPAKRGSKAAVDSKPKKRPKQGAVAKAKEQPAAGENPKKRQKEEKQKEGAEKAAEGSKHERKRDDSTKEPRKQDDAAKKRTVDQSPLADRAKRQRAEPEGTKVPLTPPKATSKPPAVRASNFEAGTIRPGNDGTLWRATVDPGTTGHQSHGAVWQWVGAAEQSSPAAPASAKRKKTAAPNDCEAAAQGAGEEKKPAHPFAVGDTVEGVYKEGSWALATVRSTSRARQVLVEYVREQEEPVGGGDSGPRYRARENETPRAIAARLGLPLAVLLQINKHVAGLSASSKLRQNTPLLLPDAQPARENDTVRSIAQQWGRPLDATLALNALALSAELQPAAKLRAGTLVLLPRAPPGEHEAEGGARGPPPLPHLGEEVEVEVDEGGRVEWRRAEVRRLVSSSRFEVCVGGDEDFMEEYKLGDEGSEWRRNQPAAVERPRGTLPGVGDEVEVEVEDGGRTRWRRAEVRRLLPTVGDDADGSGGGGGYGADARFSVVVDGDEDFVEEYGQAEEGTEWRHLPRGDARWRVQEWCALSLVRPNPPVTPPLYIERAKVGTPVQVWQDGLWWRATVQSLANADGSPFHPGDDGGGSAEADDPPRSAPTLVVSLLARPDAPPLRVRPLSLRPDWEYSPQTRAGWRLWAPPPPRAPPPLPHAAPDEALRSGAAPGTARWSAYARGGAVPTSAPAWASDGQEVEVRLGETWLAGGWWAAQLIEVAPRGALLLLHDIAEEDGSEERWQEWAPWGQVRPLPPVSPPDFLAATREGEAVELWWEDAWWPAVLLVAPRRGNPASVRLDTPKHRNVRSADERLLRPGWRWATHGGGGSWAAPCIALPLNPPPATLDLNCVSAASTSPSAVASTSPPDAAAPEDDSDDEELAIR